MNFRVCRKSAKTISLTVGDRAISSKFSTPRVCRESTTPTFEKFFKNGGHFEFWSKKCKNTKMPLSPQPLEIERFRRNFPPPGYQRSPLHPLLTKFFKNGGHFEFSNFLKECKNCFYLSKFSTPRVFKEYTTPTFEKIFKNGGHFEFSSKKCENTKMPLSP